MKKPWIAAWLLIGIVTNLLTGCMVGPKYHRPESRPPEVFRDGAAPGPPPDPSSIGELQWFEVFKDEKLQDLIRIAFLQNYDLREAVVRIDAARAQLGITRSEQLPGVVAGTSLTSNRNPGSVPPIPGVNPARNFGTVALNMLSFELDIWGRLRSATEASRAELLAADETRKAVTTTLISDVATSYFNLLELDAELELARNTLATRQESLRLIKIREQGGVATMLDVRQAEQLVYSASQTIPDTERRIEQAENRISLLLGKTPGEIPRGKRLTEQEQPPAAPPGLPSSLLERRPDIHAAEQRLIAANALIGVARASYFPQISLTGLLGFQSNQLSGLFTGPARAWSFAPQIATPIFTGSRVKSGVQFSEAQRQLALVDYERVIQTAFREVSDALIEYRKVKEIRAQQETLVSSLRDRSRLAYMRYRGGVDTQLNALDADRDLFNAELNLTQTWRNELLALVQLYKALGGGWRQ
jgi:multidrug efflux system outer membrane protein